MVNVYSSLKLYSPVCNSCLCIPVYNLGYDDFDVFWENEETLDWSPISVTVFNEELFGVTFSIILKI
jgi:hypothetical protein